MTRIRKLLANLGVLVAAFAVCLLLLEVALRIYNPLPFRVRGTSLRLPRDLTYHLSFPNNPQLDGHVVDHKNSLGFRGPEPPPDLSQRLSVVAVGGSTTECFDLGDGKTWEDRLAIDLSPRLQDLWIENAGLDGQSSFGHLMLMRQYIDRLHPRVVLFLVGANDVGIRASREFDEAMIAGTGSFSNRGQDFKGLLIRSADHSEAVGLFLNLYRAWQAHEQGLSLPPPDFRSLPHGEMPGADEMRQLKASQQDALDAYGRRLHALVVESRDHGIEPVLITQPVLFGGGRDPVTGIDLGTVILPGGWLDIDSHKRRPAVGEAAWEQLQWYNDVMRQVAKQDSVLLIDLANQMPKSTEDYYDFFHYTNQGAEQVAGIVAQTLGPWLEQRWPQFKRREQQASAQP